ncbi:response regulator [Methylosoma difficile]
MKAEKHILIVEDEEKLAYVLEDYLHAANFTTHWLADGAKVTDWFNTHPVDLILLDLMLPNVDGLEIAKTIRKTSKVPIIMITARIEEIDRLLGLELGADDYICKPFSPREVVARIKAVLRRTYNEDVDAQTPTTLSAPLLLDGHSFCISANGRQIMLTHVEFQLFQVLYQQPNRIFSRVQLIDKIYQDHRIVSDRTVDSHIKKLRKKLAGLLPEIELIHSVYGAGYRYAPQAKSAETALQDS